MGGGGGWGGEAGREAERLGRQGGGRACAWGLRTRDGAIAIAVEHCVGRSGLAGAPADAPVKARGKCRVPPQLAQALNPGPAAPPASPSPRTPRGRACAASQRLQAPGRPGWWAPPFLGGGRLLGPPRHSLTRPQPSVARQPCATMAGPAPARLRTSALGGGGGHGRCGALDRPRRARRGAWGRRRHAAAAMQAAPPPPAARGRPASDHSVRPRSAPRAPCRHRRRPGPAAGGVEG